MEPLSAAEAAMADKIIEMNNKIIEAMRQIITATIFEDDKYMCYDKQRRLFFIFYNFFWNFNLIIILYVILLKISK